MKMLFSRSSTLVACIGVVAVLLGLAGYDALVTMYPGDGWKKATATVFWVGEAATEENAYIQNASSAWEEDWQEHYGGVDDPEDRCGFRSCAFMPQENSFYVALPYNDLDDNGKRKANAARVPSSNAPASVSIVKNRWIEVRVGQTSCFGQWEDVGPFEADDIEYVFGSSSEPLNQYGMKAGIDLSPALRDCLGVGDVSNVRWRHMEEEDVPAGPWKDITTTK